MRKYIINLQKGMEGLVRKLRDTIKVSLEYNLEKIVERLHKKNKDEEMRRHRNIEALVRNAGKGVHGLEKSILSKTAPTEMTGSSDNTGEQNRENTTRDVALLDDSEVQVVEEERTGSEVPKVPSVPQPMGKEQQQGDGLGPQTGGNRNQTLQGGGGQIGEGNVGGGGSQMAPTIGMGGQMMSGGPGVFWVPNGAGGFNYVYGAPFQPFIGEVGGGVGGTNLQVAGTMPGGAPPGTGAAGGGVAGVPGGIDIVSYCI